MLEPRNNNELPAIPGKRYFTIGEVSELCGVKPHVLRYWEQEFPQLKPVKRRGNRRYYQRQDVIVIRQIRSLLYEQGFTIGGARNKLTGDEARTDITPEPADRAPAAHASSRKCCGSCAAEAAEAAAASARSARAAAKRRIIRPGALEDPARACSRTVRTIVSERGAVW